MSGLRLVEPEAERGSAEGDRAAWTSLATYAEQIRRTPGITHDCSTALDRIIRAYRGAAGLPLVTVAVDLQPDQVAWGFVADGYRTALGVPGITDRWLSVFLRSEARACRLAGRR